MLRSGVVMLIGLSTMSCASPPPEAYTETVAGVELAMRLIPRGEVSLGCDGSIELCGLERLKGCRDK